jgi:hypothetical protein
MLKSLVTHTATDVVECVPKNFGRVCKDINTSWPYMASRLILICIVRHSIVPSWFPVEGPPLTHNIGPVCKTESRFGCGDVATEPAEIFTTVYSAILSLLSRSCSENCAVHSVRIIMWKIPSHELYLKSNSCRFVNLTNLLINLWTTF